MLLLLWLLLSISAWEPCSLRCFLCVCLVFFDLYAPKLRVLGKIVPLPAVKFSLSLPTLFSVLFPGTNILGKAAHFACLFLSFRWRRFLEPVILSCAHLDQSTISISNDRGAKKPNKEYQSKHE